MILKKLIGLGVLLAVALLSSACASGGKSWWNQGDQQGSWGVELLVNGSPVPVFEHSGNSWVEGRSGERFVLRVHSASTLCAAAMTHKYTFRSSQRRRSIVNGRRTFSL